VFLLVLLELTLILKIKNVKRVILFALIAMDLIQHNVFLVMKAILEIQILVELHVLMDFGKITLLDNVEYVNSLVLFVKILLLIAPSVYPDLNYSLEPTVFLVSLIVLNVKIIILLFVTLIHVPLTMMKSLENVFVN
jgi:hypothetical protein